MNDTLHLFDDAVSDHDRFHRYLLSLGYSHGDIEKYISGDRFAYPINAGSSLDVKYILTLEDQDIFHHHNALWNRNSDVAFIAVGKEKSHIINAKQKPDPNNILKSSIRIASFDYGINTAGYEGINFEEITKGYVNSAYFFDFVSKRQRKTQEVDKDLLLNLLALRNDLRAGGNERIIHLLILRCLFVKYLEDRGIFDKDYLLNILKGGDPHKLLAAFDEIRKINGDVFKFDEFEVSDIKADYINKITLFFKTDYRSKQAALFPYRFDQIPIQLISHVYEAFLKSETKKGTGIYYTPSFLVDFMLSQTLKDTVQNNLEATVLDPAVGSGAFLVESFKIITEAYGENINFATKKRILEQQLFGIDIDRNALQIAAFSLYLALLETEEPAFIKEQIEHAHPILPSLIGKTLIHGNALTEPVFENKTFNYVVSNPPWGSVPTDNQEEHIKERNAIDNVAGAFPEYDSVADYERSQAFLIRVERWGSDDTVFTMVVKNSIFLNDKSKSFRSTLLHRYQINTFYELSHYNKILFKKRTIGEVEGKKIELGASEPCAVLILRKNDGNESTIRYISPKLSQFSQHFETIQYSQNDLFKVSQHDFIKDDKLWRILVNGDVEGYDLIDSKVITQDNVGIEAKVGFQPKKEMKTLGDPIWKKIIEPTDFEQFCQKNEALNLFDWNQDLRRKPNEDIFKHSRIIVPVRPLKADDFLFRGVHLKDEVVHKHNILSIKLKDDGNYVSNYLPYLGIINSQLIGYLFFQLSIQWGKGEGKRDTLRNVDVEALPIKKIHDTDAEIELTDLVDTIIRLKSEGRDASQEIYRLNDLIFDLYDLLDYEKEIIREFYQVRVERAGKEQERVRQEDIQKYFNAFTDTFSLILASDNTLQANYHISPNIGAVICISIVSNHQQQSLTEDTNLHILNFVKAKQLQEAEALKILNEDKVKLYEKDRLYIIKSNYFKDWTVRQAIKDAREEIAQFMKHLPARNEYAS